MSSHVLQATHIKKLFKRSTVIDFLGGRITHLKVEKNLPTDTGDTGQTGSINSNDWILGNVYFQQILRMSFNPESLSRSSSKNAWRKSFHLLKFQFFLNWIGRKDSLIHYQITRCAVSSTNVCKLLTRLYKISDKKLFYCMGTVVIVVGLIYTTELLLFFHLCFR